MHRGFQVLAYSISVVCLPVAARAAPERINWDGVPDSQLPEIVGVALWRLRPHLATGKTLIVPVNAHTDAPRRSNWAFEEYASQTMHAAARTYGFNAVLATQVDANVLKNGGNEEQMRKGIRSLADKADARTVLFTEYNPGTDNASGSLAITAYGRTGGALSRGSVELGLSEIDDDYYACTPPANRRASSWTEKQLGKKIRRGECWDLPAQAMMSCGLWKGIPSNPYNFGRALRPGETPFPGDVVCKTPRKHCVVIYRPSQGNNFHVLHQNWMWGKEKGRRVAWASLNDLEKHKVWRVHSSQADRKAFAARVEKAKQMSVSDFPVKRDRIAVEDDKVADAPSISPTVVAQFDRLLLGKLAELALAMRLNSTPVRLACVDGECVIESVTDDGTLTLRASGKGSNHAKQIRMGEISLIDKASLAGLVRRVEKTNKGACAFIGFYLMAAGHTNEAERFLGAAGEDGDEVRKLFKIRP